MNNLRIIAPSILSADFCNLGKDIDLLNASEAAWIHVDIMDGVFVPNISFGFPVLEAVRKQTNKVCDVHLMIVNPEKYIPQFKTAGADIITIHYEGNLHLDYLVKLIKSTGAKAAIALNPATPVAVLKDILPDLDMVLIMSVNPGFGGQQFIEKTVQKVTELSQQIQSLNLSTIIEVDGGVNIQNAKSLFDAGATVLVAGNAVFKSKNPTQMITDLLQV